MSRKNKQIYRIQFHNQGHVYELYARKLVQGDFYAFVEASEIIFGERSAVLVDPTEERLKAEFAGVKRTLIPIQAIIRIDEVDKEGANRILPGADNHAGNVTAFPQSLPPRPLK